MTRSDGGEGAGGRERERERERASERERGGSCASGSLENLIASDVDSIRQGFSQLDLLLNVVQGSHLQYQKQLSMERTSTKQTHGR